MADAAVFVEPEQITAIAEVALTVLETYAQRTWQSGRTDAEIARSNEDFDTAVHALWFCASAAGRTGDAAFAPLLHDIGAELAQWGSHVSPHRDVVATAVGTLLRRGAAIDAGIELLAEHGDAAVRAAVAHGLAPTGAGRALLETLARDVDAEVRKAALAKLATVREVAWWTGSFASDPLVRLSPEEGLALRAALELAARAVADGAALAPALRKLPDALAVEVAEAALAEPAARQYADGPALVAELLARPGGVDAFGRLVQRWAIGDERSRSYAGERVAVDGAAKLPKGRRLAVSLELARVAAASAPGAERELRTPAALVAKVAAAAFPPGADVTPLLDLLVTMPLAESGADWVASALLEPLGQEAANLRRAWPRLFEACLAGWPGVYEHLSLRDQLLARAPARVLRRAAEQGLVSPHDGVATWALGALLGAAHDAERDGPRLGLVRRFFAEPRLRALLGRDFGLAKLAVPLLRSELRAGRLAFAEAHNTLSWITRLWGGAAPIVRFGRARKRPVPEDPGAEERKGLRGLLGAKALQGPPTDDEWALYRAARAATPPSGWTLWREQMGLMPPGPFHADDRALLDACVAEARAGDTGHAWLAAMVLAGKPRLEDAPLVDELCAVAAGSPDHGGYVRENRLRFREALGLPTDDEASSAPAPATEGAAAAWMDRDDDD